MGDSTAEMLLAGPRHGMRALCAAAIAMAVLLVCLPLFGQTDRGRILGNVHDSTGAVLVGAKVTITDVQRGISRNLTTDNAGAFQAPDLLPGTATHRRGSYGSKSYTVRSGRIARCA